MKCFRLSCVVLCLGVTTAAAAQEVPGVAPPVMMIVAQDQPPAQPATAAPRGLTPQPPQQPVTTPPPARQSNPPPPMRLQGQPINVRIEVTITDQTGTAAAVKKTVLMTVADEERGSIRSNAQIVRTQPSLGQVSVGPPRIDNVPLSIDATPTVLGDTRIRLRLNLEYDVAGGTTASPAGQAGTPGTVDNSQVRQSLTVMLTTGVPLVVAQSADPHSDRRVSLEVKATILK